MASSSVLCTLDARRADHAHRFSFDRLVIQRAAVLNSPDAQANPMVIGNVSRIAASIHDTLQPSGDAFDLLELEPRAARAEQADIQA